MGKLILILPSLDFWVAKTDGQKIASHTRYTKYNLAELIKDGSQATTAAK